MAKRGILNHPKIIRMSRKLGISKPHAVGLMECFWQWVAQHRPDGDLTGVEPEDITDAICHPDDPQAFWDTLLEVRWVDALTAGVFCVHDWSEHADDSIHTHLARRKSTFADGKPPKLSRLTKAEQTTLSAFYEDSALKSAGKRAEAPESALARSSVAPCPLPLAPCPLPTTLTP